MPFWAELRRRNVFKVGAAYLVAAWLLAQVVGLIEEPLGLPVWFDTAIIVFLAVGFPIAVLLAWAYEITPEGVKKTRPVPLERSIAHFTGQKLSYVVTGLLALAVIFIIADRYVLERRPDMASSELSNSNDPQWRSLGSLDPSSAAQPVTSPSEYVQLTDFAGSVVDPSLSPDGRMVTFIRGGQRFPWRDAQVYLKVLPNGESVRLTDTPYAKYGPVFTADGARIAYTEVRRFEAGLSWDTWTVPILGGSPTRLLPNAAGLSWTDDGHVLFSEIKGSGIHMGIVTATESRGDRREIYFPSHERAMAHYSYPSPDRRWLLLAEMDGTGAFQPCRVVPFDGSSVGRQVGPRGECTAAGWSPDGIWMYFSVSVEGRSHIWRERFLDGIPEQITLAPTEEVGVAVAPDGQSIITAIGQRQSTIWIQDAAGARPLSLEGSASDPRLSPTGERVYYLVSLGSAPPELRSNDLRTGAVDRLLPGIAVKDYEVSRDQREIAFTTVTGTGESQIWLASLDRSQPPRLIARSGDQVSFGDSESLLYRSIGNETNFLSRVDKDGTSSARVSGAPILEKSGVSPDGEWAVVSTSGPTQDAPTETIAVPTDGGSPIRICLAYCRATWSPRGDFLYVQIEFPTEMAEGSASSTRTLGLPISPGQSLPKLPASGVDSIRLEAGTSSGSVFDVAQRPVWPGSDPSVYVFTESQVYRNIFRIPLH